MDVRSFLNVFAPSSSGKNETIRASVETANISEKANCQENANAQGKEHRYNCTNEANNTENSEKRKDTHSSNNSKKSISDNNMSFDIADASVPTLGIPGSLYCIPHTSRRCFFPVDVQAQ